MLPALNLKESHYIEVGAWRRVTNLLCEKPRVVFLKSPETFGTFVGCYNSLYTFWNPEVLSHQTSQSSCFFLH